MDGDTATYPCPRCGQRVYNPIEHCQPEKDGPMQKPQYYVLSPSEEWTQGFLVGRFPGMIGVGKHLTPVEVDKVTSRDTVVIIGGWSEHLSSQQSLAVEKALHDSRARIQNGAGITYVWPYPHAWDPEARCCE